MLKNFFKSIFLVFITFSLSLPAYSQTAEECEYLLQEVAKSLNDDCPMDMGDGLVWVSCTYQDKNFNFAIKVPDFSAEEFALVQPIFKDFIIGEMLLPDDEAGSLLVDALQGAGAKFGVTFILDDSTEPEIFVTPEELKSYLK